MRITNNILSRSLLYNLNNAQQTMYKLENQLSSGLKITKPSDNPVAMENALRYKSTIAHVNQWKANASEGIAYLDTADDTLANLTEVLQRAKTLALQGANGSLNPNDREKIAIEVKQLKDQVIEIANTRVGNKYLFAGTKNVQPLSRGDEKWEGSDDIMKFPVGSSLSLEISVNGQELFGVKNTYDADGNVTDSEIEMLEVFDKLIYGLEKYNMEPEDPSEPFIGVEEFDEILDKIEQQMDRVLDYRAQLGARQNRMDAIHNQLDNTAANLSNFLADTLYADIAETLVHFKTQENVYNAALAVGAQIIQPSLVDFMR